DTDWQDLDTRTGFQQNHNLSLSGANDQTNYYVSFGYTDLKGILLGNDQRKYQMRFKLEQKALDIVTVGVNANISHVTNNGLNTGTNALSGNIANALRALPNVPAKWNDGTYNLSPTNTLGAGANGTVIADNYPNILYVLDHNIYRNKNLNVTGNAFVNVEIIKGLNLKTQIGINLLNGEDYQYWNPIHGDGRGNNGYLFQQAIPYFRYNWTNTLSYNKQLGDHNINAVAGLEFQKTRDRFYRAEGNNITSSFFGENGNIITNSVATPSIGGGVSEGAFRSYFIRASYAYKDRYIVSGTFRRDALSSLAPGNQNANFPGVSAGWRISQENFFKNAEGLSFISNLKLRGGYATVGNVDIGYYPYAGTFKPVQYGSTLGLAFNQLANPNLSFETSKKYNIGLDLGLLEDRINITADLFKNDIDGMIMEAPIAPSLGVPGNSKPNVYFLNAGKMYNKGFELSINSTNISNDKFTWTTSFNVTFLKNEVTQLANGNADLISPYNITRVGERIGEFYGYVSRGVNPANGNPLWEKADGSVIQGDYSKKSGWFKYDPSKPDDVSQAAEALGQNDKRLLGHSMPTYYGGLNNTVTYKGFDLNVFFSFSGGNKVYNVTRQEALNNQKFMNNGKEILNRWTTPGQVTDVPKLYNGSDGFVLQTGNVNSRFLEDGAFIRAQNIGIGYTFPKRLIESIRLSNIRVYAQVQNAFVITKYTGVDPELNASLSSSTVNTQPGLDYNTNPVPRSYTLGVNIGL
ncbi:MAG TPA: SusC/RagA family TonB-linked outer membrane protein, partial [Chitinophaga sp.]|uniref:SusC/RagA family TonB-linked outer membrane protein n=1 Tax=Chitinophaga sp. TaxID=1869181 RepID=UPI002C841E19